MISLGENNNGSATLRVFSHHVVH